jgi:tripartite-type tricarboxylate transporter receptor subunit TctC
MASTLGIFSVLLTSIMLVWPMRTSAQEPFFKGKTVRIVVGFAAGGGFDTYTRRSRVIGAGIFPAIHRSSSKIWPAPAV